MAVRGVRGATTCSENTASAILAATQELVTELVKRNRIETSAVAAAVFSLTEDLDAAFPAQAVRAMGWDEVPLFCCREIPVPGSLPRCVRVLLLVNSDEPQSAFRSVYLGGAEILRPDLAKRESGENA